MKDQELKQLEMTLWKTNFQDGISDISIGLILIISSLCQTFSSMRFYLYLLFFIPIIGSTIAKRKITIPRIGIVKYSRQRNRKRTILFSIMTASILILLLLTFLGIPGEVVANTGLIIGLIILLVCISLAFFMDFDRMYIYGFLLAGSFFLSEYLIMKTGEISKGAISWLVSGLIMIITGTLYLINFLKKYEVNHD